MNRKTILQEIFSNFQQITQWMYNPPYMAEYHFKAQSLIELLEVEDCGSVGGHDNSNPTKWESGYPLYDRFLTLLRKENTKLKKEVYFTPESMEKYFKQLTKLRETFNG